MADYYLHKTAAHIDELLEKVEGIESGANVNVQADWNQTTATADDYIKNKPTLGTASALNVSASGDAATTEVVKGDDSRLTDARHADDVYSWAKDANKPAYSSSEVSDLSNLTTTDKTSLVGAVNELNAILGDVNIVLEEVL